MPKKPDKKIGLLRNYLLDSPQVVRRGEAAVEDVDLCDYHAAQLNYRPEYGMAVDGPEHWCLICGDPRLVSAPVTRATGIEEDHHLPGPADFDRESLEVMLREAARSGEVPRERAMRVYLSDPQRAREVGWAAVAGIAEELYTADEFQDALDALLASWQSGDDEYMELLDEARRRCDAEQWANVQVQVLNYTGVFPGNQEGDDHGQ
jgi:hypothetical protein